MENHIETWQTEVNGQIYESSFEELTQWITEGSLLPNDMVRKGNLRWIEARKIPLLLPFFNARESGIVPPPIQTSYTTAENTKNENYSETQNFAPISNDLDQSEKHHSTRKDIAPQSESNFEVPVSNICVLHPENEAIFHCETCGNAFCPQCPKSYGGSVKICPMCGAMCKKIGEIDVKKVKEIKYRQVISEGFGIQDIALSFAHPFKFMASLVFGAIIYMFLTIGQNAVAAGGIAMIFAAIVCFMMANMLAFGIMANTIENFSQGKLEKNFMPDFDDFNLWDDVIHPFFLTIGIYLSSLGPLFLVIAVGIFVVVNAMQTNTKLDQSAETDSPFMIDEQRSLNQSDEVKKLMEGVKTEAERKRAITENGLDQSGVKIPSNEENDFNKVNQMIAENKKAELESVVGKSPETKEKEFGAMYSKLKEQGIVVVLLGLVALLWGIFYVPAACAVAGYTRSFSAALNPTYGIDFIKRIGVDYLIILAVYVAMLVAGVVFSITLNLILFQFNLPGMGNIPATAIVSLYTFFVTIVLACILGRAVLKNSEKLGLYQG